MKVSSDQTNDNGSDDPINEDIDARRRLVRKLDIRLLPLYTIMFFLCVIDRINIGHVRLYNFEKDIGITKELFGWGLTVFFIGYVILEIPSNLFLKKYGANLWFSRIIVSWGLATLLSAWCTNGTGFIILRFLLGLAEAGLFPGILYMISLWYRKDEQALRIAIFASAASVGSLVSGPLTSSISKLGEVGGLKSWQWVFIIESIPTILFGIYLIWGMPISPKTCTWLTESERDQLTTEWEEKKDPHSLSLSSLCNALKSSLDFKTIMYAIIQFAYLTPKYAQMFLLPTLVQDLGFDNVTASYLTSPPHIVAFIISMITSWTSDRYLERSLHLTVANLLAVLGHTLLLFLPSHYTALRYLSLIFIVTSGACSHSSFFAWANNNTHGATQLAITTSFLAATGNIGGMIAGQFYRASEAPRYPYSHSISILGYLTSIIVTLILRHYLQRTNRTLKDSKVQLILHTKYVL